jgi:hypothetical protein
MPTIKMGDGDLQYLDEIHLFWKFNYNRENYFDPNTIVEQYS